MAVARHTDIGRFLSHTNAFLILIVPWNDFESVTGVKENVVFDGGSAVKPSRNSSGHETDLSGRGIVVQSNLTGSKSERLLINTLSTAGGTELMVLNL